MTTIIEDAKIYATHAKKSTVDADDIKLAIQCRMDQSFTSPPPRDVSVLPGSDKLRPEQKFFRTSHALCVLTVPPGGRSAEEPDPPPSHQTVLRPAAPPRPLLSHGAQLQAEVHPEEGGSPSPPSV